MSMYIEGKITYVSFEVGGSLFAIPIKETRGIILRTATMPCIVLPGMPNFVRCIIETDGLLVTVINVTGSYGNMPIVGNKIVVLEHSMQNIGIIADKICLITVSDKEIVENGMTGATTFKYDGETYIILDLGQLYKDLGI